jgi:hypothetical protein
MPIQVQEASRRPNSHDQNRTYLWHIIAKIISAKSKERILKAVRKKIKWCIKVNTSKQQQIFNRNLNSKKGMEYGILGTERKQFQI